MGNPVPYIEQKQLDAAQKRNTQFNVIREHELFERLTRIGRFTTMQQLTTEQRLNMYGMDETNKENDE